jgi:hypothetical protein
MIEVVCGVQWGAEEPIFFISKKSKYSEHTKSSLASWLTVNLMMLG